VVRSCYSALFGGTFKGGGSSDKENRAWPMVSVRKGVVLELNFLALLFLPGRLLSVAIIDNKILVR
jgi:hypothetical protein